MIARKLAPVTTSQNFRKLQEKNEHWVDVKF